jgi:hypothetical protein
MKRDMDLIRKIVLAIEDGEHAQADHPLKIDGASESAIGYHAYLLVDAGLAEGIDATTRGSDGPEYILTHLTWAGHEFADACRNETVWNQAKAKVKQSVGSVTFDVFKELLVSFLKGAVGLS